MHNDPVLLTFFDQLMAQPIGSSLECAGVTDDAYKLHMYVCMYVFKLATTIAEHDETNYFCDGQC